ncbi:sterol desaturase family protein [Sphingomonas nostoxanthinifaciens]|uniref:sterol desaturase family protein n=1 Tax=Sphingomonas nostoxanthinifaciens TaxID=2872652 RepID=UPI001CC1E8DB|nr:sterol desaturase family protein [Sphingomonas nostoxanthinifaciens]UAK24799.1 sterol desaturase family protein [Sphingomonas nostoxanthinifaciens]
MGIHGLIVDVARLLIWLALLSAILVPVERWFALRPGHRTSAATAADLGFYFLNSLLPGLLLGFPVAALAAVAHRLLPSGYFGWLNSLPLWLQLVASFVVGEIGFYWGHRWSHTVPLLWRFHALHHRPDHLDWLVNTRAHPVDIVFGRLCGLAPIYLTGLAGRGAGADNLPAILFTIAGTIWGFLLHANIRWTPRWLEPLLATPRFHHWHHVKSGPIDRNYASMLPVMDRMFGTLHMPTTRAWPEDYGVREADAAPIAETRPASA